MEIWGRGVLAKHNKPVKPLNILLGLTNTLGKSIKVILCPLSKLSEVQRFLNTSVFKVNVVFLYSKHIWDPKSWDNFNNHADVNEGANGTTQHFLITSPPCRGPMLPPPLCHLDCINRPQLLSHMQGRHRPPVFYADWLLWWCAILNI